MMRSQGWELVSLEFAQAEYVKDKGNATTGVGFDFRTPLQGEPVIPSLDRIAEEVRRTIEAFKIAGFV